jgi:hypothetical protein
VSRAKQASNVAQGASVAADNIILLPFIERSERQPVQQLMFADDKNDNAPPWLLDDTEPVKAKRVAKRPASSKQAIHKKPAAKKTKPKNAKTKAKRRPARKPRKAGAINAIAVDSFAAPAPAIAAPLTRAQAPVVWHKNGALDVVRYWLRTVGRNMKATLVPAFSSAHKYQEPKLRTRKELLLEIAILREENAMMRKRLGLPPMPFGRQVADHI